MHLGEHFMIGYGHGVICMIKGSEGGQKIVIFFWPESGL